jgi:hypothetical protein
VSFPLSTHRKDILCPLFDRGWREDKHSRLSFTFTLITYRTNKGLFRCHLFTLNLVFTHRDNKKQDAQQGRNIKCSFRRNSSSWFCDGKTTIMMKWMPQQEAFEEMNKRPSRTSGQLEERRSFTIYLFLTSSRLFQQLMLHWKIVNNVFPWMESFIVSLMIMKPIKVDVFDAFINYSLRIMSWSEVGWSQEQCLCLRHSHARINKWIV